ncbi:Aminopeptidase 2 mitochondrial [Coemansia furcata]|uniref:Aminopeptidase 2 mitochondrial n=1 Tax=Coemansia furcata TaxID=417177 RepID=A0ACC1LL45_9FUNG|nr:Aminopeptidase 2 mitochondrial [Coemansia furcata]
MHLALAAAQAEAVDLKVKLQEAEKKIPDLEKLCKKHEKSSLSNSNMLSKLTEANTQKSSAIASLKAQVAEQGSLLERYNEHRSELRADVAAKCVSAQPLGSLAYSAILKKVSTASTAAQARQIITSAYWAQDDVTTMLAASATAAVLNDAVALAISGYVPTSAVFDMVAAFQILGMFLESLHQSWADRSPPALCEHIRSLARALFAPQATALGWSHRPGDSPLVARLRAISIPRAAWAGDVQVIAQALAHFEQFYTAPSEPKPFHHDFTASVFEIAVRCGPETNHSRVRDMYEHSARWRLSEDHRMAALGAMACTRDPNTMWQTLDYVLSEHVLPQDLNIVMGFMVPADHRSKHVLWHWFKLNYQHLVARLGEASALLGHVVSTVVGDFSTEEMADDDEQWFANKHTAASDRMLLQSLEFIRVRTAWFERDHDDV